MCLLSRWASLPYLGREQAKCEINERPEHSFLGRPVLCSSLMRWDEQLTVFLHLLHAQQAIICYKCLWLTFFTNFVTFFIRWLVAFFFNEMVIFYRRFWKCMSITGTLLHIWWAFLLIMNCVFNLDALLADLQTAVYPSSGATPPPSSLAKHNETFDYNVERSVSHNWNSEI
jgi:hypothetical protein